MMKKQLTLGRALTVFLPLLLICCVLTAQMCYRFMYIPARSNYQSLAAALSEKYDEKDALIKELKSIKELFDGKYVGELDEQALIAAVMRAYVKTTGDRFAAYYTPEEYEKLQASYESQGEGIGVRVSATSDGRLLIAHVEKKSPAEEAGIQKGDEILSVEGQSVLEIGTERATELLVGKEGSEAVFSVKGESGTREVSVTRKKINYATVIYSLEEGQVGYLRILSFGNTTCKEMEDAIKELTAKGALKLVFDLRQNGGGLLSAVHDMLDLLIKDGTMEEPRILLSTIDKNKNEKRYLCDDGKSVDLPMAVLIDEHTASAAELFAAALRDYEMARLVGTTTYGKGVAQSTYELEDGSAVRLTTSYYYPPCGENYDGVGVAPHREVSGQGLNIYLTPLSQDPVFGATLEELNK